MAIEQTTIPSTVTPDPAPVAAAPAPTETPATPAPAAPAANQPDFRTTIPETYREKAWAKNFKSSEDVFRDMDNLQGLLGKQGKLQPADDAPKEEWDKYYSNLGRPESPDKYVIKQEEGSKPFPEAEKAVRQAFYDAGLTPKQAEVIQDKYAEAGKQVLALEQAAIDEEFTKFSKEIFGDNMDKALAESQELLGKLIPEAAKKFLPVIGNEALVVLASVLKEVKAKYVGEDKTRLNNNNNVVVGGDVDSLRVKARAIMASPAFQQGTHPGHDAAVAEKNQIYAEIARLNGGKAA